MANVAPINSRVPIVDPRTGMLTREGFQILQILRGTVVGDDGSGQLGVPELNAAVNEINGEIEEINETIEGLSEFTSLSRDAGNVIIGDGTKFIVRSGAPLRSAIGLAIGTDVQAHDADLDAIAALASNGIVVRSGAGTFANRSIAGTGAISVVNGDGVAGSPSISAAAASTTVTGVVELATDVETIAGTDATRAVTPAGAAATYQPLSAVLTGLAAGTFNATTQSYFAINGSNLAKLTSGQVFGPTVDEGLDIGSASERCFRVWASNGTIQTSDGREKTPVRPLNSNEIAAAKEISRAIGLFSWLTRPEDGEFCGITVQTVIEIVDRHGLDHETYGFIRFDEWEGGNRYSLDYSSLSMFLAAGVEARLSEAGL